MKAMRVVRCLLVAAGGAAGMFLIPSTAQVVHAYTGNGTRVGSAQAGYDDFFSLGPIDQQYDCADTFS